MPRSVSDIDKAIEQLKALRAAKVAKESSEERRIRTRRAAILGGWLLANDPDQVELIKGKLVRDQDRKAFGLEPFRQRETPAHPPAAPRGKEDQA